MRLNDAVAVAKEQISAGTGEDDAGFSLSECRAVATLPATDIERACRFYAEKLGLTAAPGAAPGHYLYQCGGATFALYETPGGRREPTTRWRSRYPISRPWCDS